MGLVPLQSVQEEKVNFKPDVGTIATQLGIPVDPKWAKKYTSKLGYAEAERWAKFPLSRLRKAQDRVRKMIQDAYKKKDMYTLRTLQGIDAVLVAAVDQKEFGEAKDSEIKKGSKVRVKLDPKMDSDNLSGITGVVKAVHVNANSRGDTLYHVHSPQFKVRRKHMFFAAELEVLKELKDTQTPEKFMSKAVMRTTKSTGRRGAADKIVKHLKQYHIDSDVELWAGHWYVLVKEPRLRKRAVGLLKQDGVGDRQGVTLLEAKEEKKVG